MTCRTCATPPAIKLELTDLSKLGADLQILGFSEQELAVALGGAGAGLVPQDEVPALGEVAVSQPGDVWLLRPHWIGWRLQGRGHGVCSACGGAAPTDGDRSSLWR
jgi:hypothetical protein